MARKEYTLDEFEQELKNFVTGCGVKITNTNTEEVNQLFRQEAIVLRRIWRNEERESNIMNYEKEYKEALERAREYHKVDTDNTLKLYAKETMEYLFPVLKESEDERSRKALIDVISEWSEDTCFGRDNVSRNEILAWLEKQGEQKPAWSEEDEYYRLDVNVAIDGGFGEGYAEELRDWLKSLKERCTWKPSNEQLNALDEVYKTHGANSVCRRIIFNLLEQLKKL